MTDKTFIITCFSFIKMGKYYFTISLIWTKGLLSKSQGIESRAVCVFMVLFVLSQSINDCFFLLQKVVSL